MNQEKIVLIQFLEWYFIEAPREIFKAWKNFLRFGLNYFSIPLLFKTLFSYWRKYQWSYGRGFDIKRYFETFFSNLISRVMGAIVRLFLIIIGILTEIFIILAGIILFLIWIFFPIILIISLFFGFDVLLAIIINAIS